MNGISGSRTRSAARRALVLAAALAMLVALVPTGASAQADPRVGLTPGPTGTAGEAASNMEKLAHRDKPAPVNGTNSDLAFTGDYAVSGNYSGINFYDVSDPANPELTTSFLCPGSQNDVSVYGDLLFLSVEGTGRVDCTTNSTSAVFRGVRIIDISDIKNPVNLGGVQTCKGSHTHTLVTDPDDTEHVYVYVSGTSGPRGTTGANGWPGCASQGTSSNPIFDENHVRYSIEVIKVPLAAPEDAEIVNYARLFRDHETGAINGLQNGPTQPLHPCATDPDGYTCSPGAAAGYSPSPNTHTCHDITTYPELGLAAGACQGNGILFDISDPVNPVRLDAVADPNFSYWHSATLNNDGTKVVFTDEWGGGGGARCMANHRREWGANAIFDVVQTEGGPKMEFASYYKLPAPQTAQENCVAHNGNLVPVPGRDIMVQSWYQGGISMYDFTDSANPVEIGFFDYGPNNAAFLQSGGFWSSYWYNGNVFGNEIARGFDSFALGTSDHINDVELAAANQVSFDEHNAQMQPRLTWPATFTTVRAWHSAAKRQAVLPADVDADLTKFVDRAERFTSGPQKQAAIANLRAVSNQLGSSSVEAGLRTALHELADAID